MQNQSVVVISSGDLEKLKDSIVDEIKNYLVPGNRGARYLNKSQACEYLGVSRHSLDKLIANGLPFHKTGGIYRISSAELDEWLLKH